MHVRGCLTCTAATDRPEPRRLRNLCPEGIRLWKLAAAATRARWRDNLPPDPTPLLLQLRLTETRPPPP